ncbi:5-(carboxyamino)imidazole ribonucleotide synthase [Peribacillus cavernae]|uniref:N5-carboxyaminoimidazole ribonucleotide synthase n=1 Tax=Peribacillus cavernae TaxID=1674310 RepID=A0A3S0V8Y7_9BACI|nr:5-(carboxyamino)imidazole ribonucleotide synthase [Peribacillus cavernae]MDQ0219848.1 5-(carboxyamino)imidazole ribonucleotide synthase [Peribacillus cavernae]RUQ27239.1 5-(carboxyamino)imidazole ribonucleotide synthase [Peribacillus cavernae]
MSILNNQIILPEETIGIIGGGQLGRMMALSAKSLGFRVAVLDPTENCPCGQVADIEITGAYDDFDSLKELAAVSDVITFEFENISSEALEWLEEHAYVPQGSELLKITQDRLLEKAAISMTGASVAPYCAINNMQDLYSGVEKVGYPCVLKTARGGYDGKGQLVIRAEEDIIQAKDILKNGKCVLEAWIPFVKEISVIVTRKADGDSSCFPVAENIHVNNILDKSIVPARISGRAEAEAVKQAQLLADELDLVGTLAVEMFITEKDEIIINELAPRPHNSGHYTLNACETSQFEQHIRAICNWPLGNTNVLKPVVMVNILGQHLEGITSLVASLPDWKIHLYGKKEAKHNRKMGHINILRSSIDTAVTEISSSGFWNLQAETEDIT